jgi:hypothetical protein
VAAVVALTVALTQQPGQGAFSAATGTGGNRVTAATSFCTSASESTVTAASDSWVDQANPTQTGGGVDNYLVLTPQGGAIRRTFVRFAMPTVPAGCDVTLATLRLYADGPTNNRTLGVHRADPAAPVWTEAGLNWNNQPAQAGTPATLLTPSGSGYLSWTVTELVRDIYSTSNNGFVVRDQSEGGAGAWQQFQSRLVANPPTLRVVWG